MSNIDNLKLLDEYLLWLGTKNYSINTIKNYRDIVRIYNLELGGKSVLEATRKDVRDHLIRQSGTNTPISLNTILTVIKVYYRFLIRRGHTSMNPADGIRRQKEDTLLPMFCVEDEIKRLYDIMDNDQSIKVRDVTMFDVFYGTGIRTSELAGLQYKDFFTDKETGFLKIRAGKGNKDREVAMPDYTRDSLTKYLVGRRLIPNATEYIFINDSGRKFTRSHIYHIMKNILGQLYDKKMGAHRLRHSFATHLMNVTGDLKGVQMQLGHASPSSTEIYLHTSIERLKDIHKKLHPKGGGKG